MLESFSNGDALIIKKSLNHYQTGDVVHFEYPLKDSTKQITYFTQRLIALPGDSIEINAKLIEVNHILFKNPASFKQNYTIHLKDASCDSSFQKKYSHLEGSKVADDLEYGFALTQKEFEVIKNDDCIKSIVPKTEKRENYDGNIFPYSEHYRWNRDYFGKLRIPKKNDVLLLDTMNIDLYSYLIVSYEKNKLEINGDSILINSALINSYTVKDNYYFVMGDNRDNAVDSRIWGFLPETNIKGKVVYTIHRNKP